MNRKFRKTKLYKTLALYKTFFKNPNNFWANCSFFNYSYGLLGASGCGKTTVLSTIVGLKSLNQGIVSVFGGIPGDRKLGIPGNRIGYMPQVFYIIYIFFNF